MSKKKSQGRSKSDFRPSSKTQRPGHYSYAIVYREKEREPNNSNDNSSMILPKLRPVFRSDQRRLFSVVSDAISDAQSAHWGAYLASGRGSVALFASIDKDSDGFLKPSEIRHFMGNVDRSGILPKVFKALDERAEEHPLSLQEFQQWLVMATQEVAGYASNQPAYESSPFTGLRSKKKEEQYIWNESTMSQSLRRMQYAVRGEVVMKADKLAAEGKKIIYTNVGNPHSVGQKPITFYRQVLALCDLPAENGVDHPSAHLLFPADVLERAREMREIVGPSGTGAYTNSQGLVGVRRHVVDYITKRDGHPAFEGDIFLTDGASSAIEMVLNALIAHDTDAIMTPIPQYPIYSALITRLGGRKIGYELDETRGWGISREELEKRLAEARDRGLLVKGLAMINPGNPTGQVMKREDIEVICTFCVDNGIVLLADEVYQRNVYASDREFISAKKIAMETPGCEHLEMVSFHSTSKGLIGECGRRGGYMELHGIDPYVHSQIYKLASSGLCSGVAGQLMTSLMVNGPKEGGESYAKFVEEEKSIFDSLARRAKIIVEGLNNIDGIDCEKAEGAMYAFPRLTLPKKAVEYAEANDTTPDSVYALSLLEETGICVVPASGFGQKDGRIGFRTTFLPPEDELKGAVEEFARHHKLFCEKYAD
jgi:aspartate/methionine/tyrosine aminotransferase